MSWRFCSREKFRLTKVEKEGSSHFSSIFAVASPPLLLCISSIDVQIFAEGERGNNATATAVFFGIEEVAA